MARLRKNGTLHSAFLDVKRKFCQPTGTAHAETEIKVNRSQRRNNFKQSDTEGTRMRNPDKTGGDRRDHIKNTSLDKTNIATGHKAAGNKQDY